MPFSVVPSNQVRYANTGTESMDDFLKLILEDGEVLYVRRDRQGNSAYGYQYIYNPVFAFDPEFLPVSLKAQIDSDIEEWVRAAKGNWWSHAYKVYDDIQRLRRQKKSIRRWYADRMYRSVDFVRAPGLESPINIGTHVEVHHDVIYDSGRLIADHHRDVFKSGKWISASPIAAILPINRGAIRIELASKDRK